MIHQPKEFTGVWIPRHIITDPELGAIEMIIYAEIACFDVCYKPNEAFAERYNLSTRTVSRTISKLIKKGYVKSYGIKEGRHRTLKVCLDPRQKCPPTLDKNVQAATTNLSNIDNKEDNKEENNIIQAKVAEATRVDPVSELITSFEAIDPKNKTYYGNKTQRMACKFLLDNYGADDVQEMVSVLTEVYSSGQIPEYFPSITSPFELKEKWIKIKQAYSRATTKTKKSESSFVW